ncbi:bifunctional proline dehydrogenase/L-glutamate gamma-semialdehyde dehydrogenase PutA [Crenalkalicoccus roseus]|uniref:bifunctional proline dehydrogenase/L-glutamate gamma-semialdehyde dehydrogenase PutA n=1 Tax=Crenalkalicoccus roseus TaxID=1485588 RepID=UPI0010801419|nr:bifunctional proline dehydrogenase/L-glutamate gamma-semialdehyde dehydrogenase PutA [Crenalkalicoccus roseus]
MPETLAASEDDRAALRRLHRLDEAEALAPLLAAAALPPEAGQRVHKRALALVRHARAAGRPGADVSAFLAEFGLDTREGVALLCLAEALLRIPDSATQDALIDATLGEADWRAHLGHADSLAVNASAFAFMLSGRVLNLEERRGVPAAIARTIRRLGEPVIRAALRRGMRVLARQFVMGRTIEEALERAATNEGRRWRHSFDMLGEAARTAADAARYLAAYRHAIGAVGRAAAGRGPVEGPGVSVKLSALHPRFEALQAERCVPALIAALGALARAAKEQDIGLTVDAEEAERLEITLDIFAALRADPALAGWEGLGLAIQAYQKRAPAVVEWVADLARRTGHAIPARLVKGAYWDAEIKQAQLQGLPDYPVFTRKAATDVSWLACARRMLALRGLLRPAFATHNAHSLAYVLELAGGEGFEAQRLHGMGEALYEQVVGREAPVRVYAPVGSHEDLLAYLVRRLLENGANTSFVHRLLDPAVSEEAIVADPVEAARHGPPRHPRIPLPRDLFPDRRNSAGLDLADPVVREATLRAVRAAAGQASGDPALRGGALREVRSPADRALLVGTVWEAGDADVVAALDAASAAWRGWDARGGAARAEVLERAAGLIESHRDDFLALLAREAGKTLADGVAEVREAADFCRWYAARAREWFGAPRELPGPTGERNTWALGGRGVFACISPWNFPLAIFVGQVAAALAAGNAVAAKPAEQTPLVAALAARLLHEAGVPREVLHLLPGDGPSVGARLVADPRVAGVAFTGGTETAQAIARSLAARPGPLVPLIAETGGINAMVVDSSALPEQVVQDALTSAFGSAGQRCSALRLLCLQEEIADRVLEMLAGAAAELRLGDPLDPATDIGPVIEEAAREGLEAWCRGLGTAPLFQVPLPPGLERGCFFAPRAYALPSARALTREVFGPVLHVVRWPGGGLDALLDDIAAHGFALTLGVHSRIEAVQRHVVERLRVGNAYVNRNQIGAVVGVQPFGGHGLSGTGPKAGGPVTLIRFATELSVSVNTAAAGGNASLLAMDTGGV